jgi:parallel beta-helix repeat protein
MAIAVWSANTAYALGAKVFPTVDRNWNNGTGMKVHVCTTAGTSGGSEPTWTTTATSTTADNTVTWTAYYVYHCDHVNGDDSTGDGSQSNPYKTLYRVFTRSTADGSGTSAAGRVYRIKRGTTDSTSTNGTITGNGLANKYIDIEPWGAGTDKPVFQTSDTSGLYAAGKSYLRITEIDLYNTNTSTGKALKFDNTTASQTEQYVNDCIIRGGQYSLFVNNTAAISNFYVDGCSITGAGQWGVLCYAASGGAVTTISFTDNEVYSNTASGAVFYAGGFSSSSNGTFSGMTFTGNTFRHNGGIGLNLTCYPELPTSSQKYSTVTVRNNTSYGNGDQGINLRAITGTYIGQNIVANNTVYENCASATTGGLHLVGCDYVLVEQNLVYNNHTNTTYDGCGIYLDVYPYTDGQPCRNCIVRQNTVYGHTDWGNGFFTAGTGQWQGAPPSSGIMLLATENCQVYGNTSYENACGICLDVQCKNTGIYHNTCHENMIGALICNAAGTTNFWKNNIFYSNTYNQFQSEPASRTVSGTLENYDGVTALSSAAVDDVIRIRATSFSANIAAGDYILASDGGGGIVTNRATKVATATDCYISVRTAFTATNYTTGTWSLIRGVDQNGQSDHNCNSSPVGDGNNYGATGYSGGNGFGVGANSITANPQLISTSDPRLEPGSPCERSGVGINSYQTFYDADGKAFRKGNPSIGAYEQDYLTPNVVL